MKLKGLINVVSDLDATLDFYQKAVDAKVKSRHAWTSDGEEYESIHLSDGVMETEMILVGKKDGKMPKRDLGSNEFHHCYIAQDFDAAHELHQEMDCILFENTEMGLYFIGDQDNHWIEIVPDRVGQLEDGPSYVFVHHNRNVQKLEPAVDFYRNILKLEPSRVKIADDKSFTLRYLRDPQTKFEVELTFLEDHVDEPYAMGDQLDALLFSCNESLEELAKVVRDEGYEAEELSIEFEGKAIQVLTLLDPDGYRVYLVQE